MMKRVKPVNGVDTTGSAARIGENTSIVTSTRPAGAPDTIVLTATGELDMMTAPDLENAVREALSEQPAVLVIDLTNVEFLSSAGIAVLLFAHSDDRVPLRVVAAERIVLRPLELSGLTSELAIHPTLRSALDRAIR